jgi:predicted transposase YbfD/YdcC
LLDQAQTEEVNRGRVELRILKIYEAQSALRTEWAGLKRIISLRRIRIDKSTGKESDSTHYYISSLSSNDALLYLDLIRKHWWIENKLHYVKDVILGEDRISFGTYDRLKKNALYRNVTMNFLKLNGFSSIKYALEKCVNNIKLCCKILRT